MLSTLTGDLANTIAKERLDQAERQRRSRAEWADVKPDPYDAVTIRLARDSDEPVLEWLAQVDGRDIPAAPLLVAEAGASMLAARSLATGHAIADPFRPTAHVVEMLELRSAHFREATDGRRSSRRAWAFLRAIMAPIRS